jgi:type VI secretion system protein ImpH
LGDYFQVAVRVQQFVGQWLRLEPGSRSRLGPPDGNCRLGVNLTAGGRVWDVQSKVRIRLGPLDYARFADFLPDRSPRAEQKSFFLLVHLVRHYAGPELDFDVQLVLRADAVPRCRLRGPAPGSRLGWNTWLINRQPAADAGDAVFSGEPVVRLGEADAPQTYPRNLPRDAPCP